MPAVSAPVWPLDLWLGLGFFHFVHPESWLRISTVSSYDVMSEVESFILVADNWAMVLLCPVHQAHPACGLSLPCHIPRPE